MQRGILTLSKLQLIALKEKLNEYGCYDELLCGKVEDAYMNIQENNNILLSEDELERILDIVGIEGDENFKSAVKIIRERLLSIRGIL